MAVLPTTNLLGHYDASDTDNIWTTYLAVPPYHSGVPADGSAVQVWDDENPPAGGEKLVAPDSPVTTKAPLWRSSTPLMSLPCLDFDGSDDRMALLEDAASAIQFSRLAGASAKTMLFSIYVEGCSTNEANSYLNEALFDAGAYFGIVIKTPSGGNYQIIVFNYDGSYDVVELTLSLATSYVVVCRHNGTTLYLDLWTAAGNVASGNVASGATADMTVFPEIGVNYDDTAFYEGRIGEMAFYDAELSGTDLTDAITYFRDKWTPSSSTGWGPFLGMQRNRLVQVT